jgi:L-histidine N-alpha-methyltransferase
LRLTGRLKRFAALDLASETLHAATLALAQAYPGVEIHAVVGDFERHLEALPNGGKRLLAFLGSTVGNLEREPRLRFLSNLARRMAPGDTFLLGTDLVKPMDRLLAAYDDAQGVTARFELNILSVLNRALDGDFDPMRFDYWARYEAGEGGVRMGLRSRMAHWVRLDRLATAVSFREGEELFTEISVKFTQKQVEAELGAAGLAPLGFWTDAAKDFALSLWNRVEPA